jgi:hypothetical protein
MRLRVEQTIDLSPGEEASLRRHVGRHLEHEGQLSHEQCVAWLREHLPLMVREYLDRSYFTVSFSDEDLMDKARHVEKAYHVGVVEHLQGHRKEFMQAFDDLLARWVEDLVETLIAEMFVHYRHESNVRFFPSVLFLGRPNPETGGGAAQPQGRDSANAR